LIGVMNLVVENLSKSYPTRSGELPVLRSINLTMTPGQALAVLGPSGSGKSTLLHLLGTLDRPTSGTYRLGENNPFALKDTALAHYRNRHIGFVFQEHYLLPQCSVLENVLVPTLAGAAADRPAAEKRARDLLERVGLSARLDHRPAELSGGERQRVAVARAILLRPALLLADEPTGNLDRQTARSVGTLLLDVHREENTILIVVTHSPELAQMLPQQMEMLDGTLTPWHGGRP
jgi:lipoprotein-releasing system ATP-binding protein